MLSITSSLRRDIDEEFSRARFDCAIANYPPENSLLTSVNGIALTTLLPGVVIENQMNTSGLNISVPLKPFNC